MGDYYMATYPDEIADALISAGANDYEKENGLVPDREELIEALYQLKATAENKYNSDYWRTLYTALSNLTRYFGEE